MKIDPLKSAHVKSACIASLAISVALVFTSHADEPHPSRRTRQDFAAAMSRVTEGMLEQEILALLGQPDDKRTENDAGGIQTARTREIWRYGTSGHLTPATLGQVYIDEQGRAQYMYGQGKPRADESIAEDELRRFLGILSAVPSYNSGLKYNPLQVIRAVNGLLPLGKQLALSIIDEHLRVSPFFGDDGREGAFLVLRTLFEVPAPPGHMPVMRVGAPQPPEPDDKRLLPLFPIAIEDDIPFLLVRGYLLGGSPEQPESHVEYFRKHGVLRARPLKPSVTPLTTLDVFARSNRWPFKEESATDPEGHGRLQLSEQILRMIDEVYRLEPDSSDGLLPWYPEDAAKRRRILGEVAALKLRWDSVRNEYTFLDGTKLPPREVVHYRRETWKPEITGLKVECATERRNRSWVEVSLRASFAAANARRPFLARVYRVSKPNETLARFDQSAHYAYEVLQLVQGDAIQLEITVDSRTLLSPEIAP